MKPVHGAFFLGIIVAGYGSGQMRIFSVPDGDIVAEVDAHAGWITGMDLASQTGRLVTTAEDGIVRVRYVLCHFYYKFLLWNYYTIYLYPVSFHS